MIKPIVHSIKIFILLLLDLWWRFEKFLKLISSGKHEVERICESNIDTYERSLQIDRWLSRTHCKPIKSFLERHFKSRDISPESSLDRAIGDILVECDCGEGGKSPAPTVNNCDNNSTSGIDNSNKDKDNHNHYKTKKSLKRSFRDPKNLEEHDIALAAALREATNELVDIVVDAKCLQRSSARCRVRLRDSIYRILGYKLSTRLAEKLAATKYDSQYESHTSKLISLWNELLESDQNCASSDFQDEKGDREHKKEAPRAIPPELSHKISDSKEIVSSRWSHIGFQGEDPGTDFRGMGLWGLCQLEYLSRRPKRLARDLLLRSLNEKHSYPLAIVGINITYNQLSLMRDGFMKHFYFDTGDQLFRGYDRTLNVISTMNELYVELFLRFDCFWHESKPKNIFEFKQLMESFIEVIKMDLCNRNFALKFIY